MISRRDKIILTLNVPFALFVGYLASPDFYDHQLMHFKTAFGCAGLQCEPLNYIIDWVTGSGAVKGGPFYSLVIPAILWIIVAVVVVSRSRKKMPCEKG